VEFGGKQWTDHLSSSPLTLGDHHTAYNMIDGSAGLSFHTDTIASSTHYLLLLSILCLGHSGLASMQ
jgi:hypothetical protein